MSSNLTTWWAVRRRVTPELPAGPCEYLQMDGESWGPRDSARLFYPKRAAELKAWAGVGREVEQLSFIGSKEVAP